MSSSDDNSQDSTVIKSSTLSPLVSDMNLNSDTEFPPLSNKRAKNMDTPMNVDASPGTSGGNSPKPSKQPVTRTNSEIKRQKLETEIWTRMLTIHGDIAEYVPKKSIQNYKLKLNTLYACFDNELPKKDALQELISAKEEKKKKIEEVFLVLEEAYEKFKGIPKKEFEFPKKPITEEKDAILFVQGFENEVQRRDQKSMQFIFQIGKNFTEIKEMVNQTYGMKQFYNFLTNKCGVTWSENYTYLYTAYYDLATTYPRLLEAPVSRYWLNSNFKKIKLGFDNDPEKKKKWGGK